jgi:integrase
MLYERNGAWYGRWRTPAGRPHRKIGRARQRGSREGLTRTQAEKRLRQLIDGDQPLPAAAGIPTVEELGNRLLSRLAAKGRKRSHIESVDSHLRVHIVPYFRDIAVDRIDEAKVERFLAALRQKSRARTSSTKAKTPEKPKPLAPKTVNNIMGTLHSVLELAVMTRPPLLQRNPCALVEKPEIPEYEDIRFLTQEELEAVLRYVEQLIRKDDRVAVVEYPLYLMAAMTGMRQGELRALRWRDLDWMVQRVRVRQNHVRGEFGTPKSKRGSRGIPVAARLVGAVDALHRASAYNSDDDLVFAHPRSGQPLDRSKVLKRFKKACKRAGVRVVRFHDLRHTFGTRVAASGKVSMRTLQEWMGHRDFKTTLRYADYQPGTHEAALLDEAFAPPAVVHSVDQSEQELVPQGSGEPR